VPGQNVGLKLTLQPVVESKSCQPAPSGLRWFSDSTGDFTEIAEAAHLSATDAASPILAVAKVLGETCGDVQWSTTWTPTNGTGGDPALKLDGALLYVYQKPGSEPGVLRVSAKCAGQSVGPIALTLLQTASGGTTRVVWLRVPDNAPVLSSSMPLEQYGGVDGGIAIGANQQNTLQFNLPWAEALFVYCNDGGGGSYTINNDGVQRSPQRGAFDPPWINTSTPVVTISGLSTLELHSDGYDSAFYVFIR
jgi:hypothetical protein